MTSTALHGTLSLDGSTPGVTVSGSGSTLSLSGMLADLNAALSGPTHGVTYTSATTGLAETVTTTLDDGHGGINVSHFVFQQAAATPAGMGTVLTGTSGKDVIFSSAGSDILTGNGGADSFVFNATFGHDTITDFAPGHDAIYIDHAAFANMSALVAAITSASGALDTVITLDPGNSITLAGVTKAQVQAHSSDFHFV
jgi:serralysin